MKLSNMFVCSIFISIILLSSCSDDSTNPPEKKYITATEMLMNGKINIRQYNSIDEVYDMLPWDLDSGIIVAKSSFKEDVGTGHY